MNSNNDFLNMVKERSAEGDIFFRPIMMQFAAHHIRRSYSDFYLDHEILVAANIACMEAFGMDAVGLISDPMREAEAFGAECSYQAETVPHCANPPIKTLEDVQALKAPDVTHARRTADRIAGARLFRQ